MRKDLIKNHFLRGLFEGILLLVISFLLGIDTGANPMHIFMILALGWLAYVIVIDLRERGVIDG